MERQLKPKGQMNAVERSGKAVEVQGQMSAVKKPWKGTERHTHVRAGRKGRRAAAAAGGRACDRAVGIIVLLNLNYRAFFKGFIVNSGSKTR